MKRVVALLAAALAAGALGACGGDGAEPGAPERATLILDFQPNAVHAGIYAALGRGYYHDAGVDLEVREPSASTDAPKLLEAGRADFAIMDIHDLAIARERGFDLVGVAPLVQRPLASVIAGDRKSVDRPCDLAGQRVGVTGLPSDDAVLDSVLSADGCDPGSVDRVTIGFNAVSSLAAGKVDAATAFWNAEGVALERLGLPIRVFRVDDFGAPRYPELVVATSRETLDSNAALVESLATGTKEGEAFAVDHPNAALDELIGATSGLERAEQSAQLHALLAAHAFDTQDGFDPATLRAWARWDLQHNIIDHPLDPDAAFDL